MSASIEIVQRIEYEVEALEPVNVEARVLDVCMVSFELDAWIEFAGGVLGNLNLSLANGHPIIIFVSPYQRLRLLNMFISEEELAI